MFGIRETQIPVQIYVIKSKEANFSDEILILLVKYLQKIKKLTNFAPRKIC